MELNIGFDFEQAAAWLSFGCYLAAGLGCVYALAAAGLSGRLAPSRGSLPRPGAAPAVTILKPLHGAEPGLYANLASFCVQDYPGRIQIVFGVQDPADPAVAVVRRLMADFSELDLELVVDPRRHGANSKVSNLANMAPHIRHDVVVLSDSDIRVEKDYLRTVLPWLEPPGVGLVSCPYRGVPTSTLWSQLEAQMINHQFLPNVLVGMQLGLARPCFGSTIALRADTLARIGGFEVFVEQLADDYAVGEAVRAVGLDVVLLPYVVAHECSERDALDLVRHELRWARTIRLLDPAGFAGSVITHPLPLALVGAVLGDFMPAGFVMIVSALASRLILQIQVDDALGIRDSGFWWGPLRDLLSFAIFVASFFGNAVTWRGQRFNVRGDGTLVYAGEIRP